MTNTIKELAKSMDVRESDLLCLAQSVVNILQKDDVADILINSDEDFKESTIKAYTVDAVKKYDSFVNTYLTVPEARESFIKLIASV